MSSLEASCTGQACLCNTLTVVHGVQVAKQMCDDRQFTILYNQATGLLCVSHVLVLKHTVTGRVHVTSHNSMLSSQSQRKKIAARPDELPRAIKLAAGHCVLHHAHLSTRRLQRHIRFEWCSKNETAARALSNCFMSLLAAPLLAPWSPCSSCKCC